MDRSTPAELARRNVVEVFNTNDDAKRRELIESMYHQDAVFYDAENTATGRESVIEAIRALIGPSEGLTFAVTAEPTALGDVARISWALSPPDAPAVVSGQDFVVVKDNLITELYTFIDQAAPATHKTRHRRRTRQMSRAPGPALPSSSPGLSRPHLFRERHPQPMQPVSCSCIRAIDCFRSSNRWFHATEILAQSRLFGVRPDGRDAKTSATSASGIPNRTAT